MKKGKSVVNEFQPSITEWFAKIGEINESKNFRKEDNTRNDRLDAFNKIIGLPVEWLLKFPAVDLKNLSSNFQKVLNDQGNELCAIRLVPKKNHLPKIRKRGLTLRSCYEDWFLKQEIDHNEYHAYICPHQQDLTWSIIFVVNKDLIFGEIVQGLHYQLTHGSTIYPTYSFQFDYKHWKWSKKNVKAAKAVQKFIDFLKIVDKKKQNLLKKEFNAKFTHDYLNGYFEGIVRLDGSFYFIDYNRVLLKSIPTPPPIVKQKANDEIQGVVASAGRAQGKIVKVKEKNILDVDFPIGSVLLTENTDVRYLALMQKAAAIITLRGGMLSHAAIIARELGKPCLVSCDRASKLKTGDTVEVDAMKGFVRILNK